MKYLIVGVAVILLAIFAVLAIADLAFLINGVDVEANVIEYHTEFAGFSNSKTEGTKPMHRGEYTYVFEVEGKQHTGHGSGWPVSKVGDVIAVQYISGSPDKNRALNQSLYTIRVCYLLIAVFGIAWAFRKLKLKHKAKYS